jgi:ABC-2 type transport system ATP-binding protein
MSAISARQLTMRYGRRIGIDRVDLEVEPGAIFGFLGPNGAGKTTAIRVLLGFLRPTAGHAEIFGVDCWRGSPRIKRDVGYLPGDLRLYPWMNVRRALRLFGLARRRDLTDAGLALADRFVLDPTVPVRKMSRGMRQKLGIILALVHEPKLLVLDEPTSGLDPLMQDELAACLRERVARGHTVFFSSHTLSEVEQLCDRVAIVRSGRIVADESLDALRRRARRQVRLVFDDAAAASACDAPGFLERVVRDGATWRGEIDGEARDLVRWCAGRPVRDLEVGPPELDTLFRRFYGTDGA